MAKIEQTTIDELKAKHGEVHLVELGDEAIIVKPADRAAWKRFRSMRADEKRRLDAPEQLLRDCCVFPAPEQLEALIDRRPGLAETFSQKTMEICGLSDEAVARKL